MTRGPKIAQSQPRIVPRKRTASSRRTTALINSRYCQALAKGVSKVIGGAVLYAVSQASLATPARGQCRPMRAVSTSLSLCRQRSRGFLVELTQGFSKLIDRSVKFRLFVKQAAQHE